MPDYNNHKVWKEVELYEDSRVYFQEHEEYTAENVYSICKQIIKVAEDKGLEGCYLKFSSHMEPYEDFLDNPSVTACGYRKLYQAEVEEQLVQDKIEAKAKELDISFYEANILMQLQEKGVI